MLPVTKTDVTYVEVIVTPTVGGAATGVQAWQPYMPERLML